MRFERVNSEEHPMYEKAMALYRERFPLHEQRLAASQKRILSDAAYHFVVIWDAAVFVGLILYWETQMYQYVEHFCILPEMRGRKYGQNALELLGRQGKTIILEIDPPVDAISVRRKGFYERCGFYENPYTHVHPPYRQGNSGHELIILSFPHRVTQTAYDDFKVYLDEHVMRDVFF